MYANEVETKKKLKIKIQDWNIPYIESSLETKYREAATLPPPPRDDLRAYPDDFIRLQITTYYSDHWATRQQNQLPREIFEEVIRTLSEANNSMQWV